MDDLARLLDHRLLILPDGHRRGAESRDVRSLRDGIGIESYGDRLAEVAHLDLRLDGRITLQTRHRHKIHIVEGKLAQLRNLTLDKYRRLGGIQTAREVIERHLHDVAAYLLRIVGIVGQRLRVGYHDEYLVKFARVLQLDPLAQRPYVVAQMKPSGGSVAR